MQSRSTGSSPTFSQALVPLKPHLNRAGRVRVRRSRSTGPSPTSLGRAGPPPLPGAVAGPRLGGRPVGAGRAPTARGGSLSARLPQPAVLKPPGLTSVPVRRSSRRRPTSPLRRPPGCGPPTPTPTRTQPPPEWGMSDAGPPGLGSALLYGWPDEGAAFGYIKTKRHLAHNSKRRCLKIPACSGLDWATNLSLRSTAQWSRSYTAQW